MNVVITGGGTGGHLSIAKSLCLELKSRDFKVFYIGSTSGQDKLWFKDSNIFDKCYFLNTTGVVNKKGLFILKSLYLQFLAILESRKIFKKHNIDFVLSVGGFSAGGAGMASIIYRIPLFIHEQNAIMGKLNKILSPFAKAVFGSFDIKLKNFIQTSYPINNDFFVKSRIRKKIQVILFLGGSQGAKAINTFALSIAKELKNRNIKIIHQCGKVDFSNVKNKYENLGFICDNLGEMGLNDPSNVDLFDFSKDLSSKLSNADFCISRAGASSIWELCANNLPSCFVPYPFAAKNHQYFNALFLKNRNLCEIMLQENLNKDNFFKYLDSINLEELSIKLIQTISKEGSREIIDKVLLLL